MLREISVTVALLFLTFGSLAKAQKSAGGKETVVSVGVGAPLTVECPLRVEQRAEWQLNGSAVPEDMRAGEQAAGEGRPALTARLHAAQARAHHAGVYTCSRAPDAPRVRVRLLPAPASASAPAVAPASAPPGASADSEDVELQVVYYDINRNITLRCPVTGQKEYQWKKNNTLVSEVAQLKDRVLLEEGGANLRIKGKASEEDYGSYTCFANDKYYGFDVRGRPLARLPDNSNVVEKQNIKLQCKVLGKPSPRVWWTYHEVDSNVTVELKTDDRDKRIKLLPNEQGLPDAALELTAAERSDAGVYTCHAGAASDETVLRVKDMYAALWPFLGICAEVFVLCAIILVYERRRTKPELDDSDTDNHDQKKS